MGLSDEEELELLELLEEEEREAAKNDYGLFAQKYIKIVNKAGESVPFVHNSIQQKINNKVIEIQRQEKPVRLIVLKARQEGVSTNEQGRIIKNTTTKSNRNALIVAHDQKSTNAIFEKARYMYNRLPSDMQPLTRASNAKELIFDIPTGYKGNEKGLNSKISIQVAGDVGIGRGDTYHYTHLSEFAFWSSPPGKDKKKQLAGILQAMPATPETIAVIESTANGFEEFKELWDEAVEGSNEWTPLFFAWHDYEEYRMPVIDDEEATKIINSLSEYEQKIMEMYRLTVEQIKWYRWKLKNDCNNDENMMKQENPSFPEEAFLTTGRPVFDNQRVSQRIEVLRKQYEKNPPKRGYFTFEWKNSKSKDEIKDETIRFIESKTGDILIYEDVQPGYPYVFGGDTKGEGKDFYAGAGINNVTGKRIATIRTELTNSKPYTWQMYCLGRYYNDALIGIEMNWNTAPIEELERLHYPRQYQREKYDDFTGTHQKKYGWKTDGNTRPLIIDKEIDLIENNIDLFTDITMLGECLTFIYDKDNRPDAMSGKHDDALFADMIAQEIRSQQSYTIEKESMKPLYPEEDFDDYYKTSDSFYD